MDFRKLGEQVGRLQEAAKEKVEKVIVKLVDMCMRAAAQTLKEGIDESLILNVRII